MAEQEWSGDHQVSTEDLSKPGMTLYLSTGIEQNSKGVNTSIKASVWYTPEAAATAADRSTAVYELQEVHHELLLRGQRNLIDRVGARMNELETSS